ncbi:CPBP family intramembrane metalloprotease [Wenzhouxiangella sp. XN79A]|uniref:CPBP family intramembrane glutamic endopeptidase n=1 Tax=Wenzhouxiangella sp. XN79A TaxID=2724193 RepID=UPI00144A563F|nr:CPBP family intramembrane glutamic endopeptidase [Wenzhouxiangella sp. XN79A]NKI33944.1 CPBP family intramembrane metalloprotease [Wenzhouxiangella sp. XN79A]
MKVMRKKIGLLVEQILLHAKAAGFCVFFGLLASALVFVAGSYISPANVDVEFLILDSDSSLNGAELEKVRESIGSLAARFGGRCGKGVSTGQGARFTFCRFSETSLDKAYDQFVSLAEFLDESGFSVSNISFEDSTELSFPPWLLLVYILIHFPVVWFALRKVSMRDDILRAANEIIVRPWWLLVPVVFGVLVSSLIYALLVFSFGPVVDGEQVVLRQDFVASEAETNQPQLLLFFFLSAIVLAPIWEEAVFRGWLYERRAKGLRLIVRAGINGWFFAGAHSIPYLWSLLIATDGARFNISLFFSWVAYLATVLCFGMLFYFIREKKNSISLVMVLHLVQNLFAFSVLVLLLPNS